MSDAQPRPEMLHEKVQRIIREVAEKNRIRVSDMVSPSRERVYAWPRQECMWRLKTETPLSSMAIARRLHRKDHTTIIYGVRAYAKRVGQ